jgi:hypothetical protein
VPKITAVIEGREYSFAPLTIKEMKTLARTKELQGQNLFETMDTWRPYIENSMNRANCEMPEIEDMDVEAGSSVFAALLRAVMEASGVKLAPMGEEQPARTNGAPSTGSSSPLPDGVSSISMASSSTT